MIFEKKKIKRREIQWDVRLLVWGVDLILSLSAVLR